MYVHTEEKRGDCIIKISADEDPPHPRRDYDPFGVLVCMHRRYDLSDDDAPKLQGDDFTEWDEVEHYLQAEHGAKYILPVFIYEHGNIALRTSSFSCPWDSGQVGFIYCTAEQAAEFKGDEEKIFACLRQEVASLSDCLSGDCWGYQVFSKAEPDVELDSCWGFLGDADECGVLSEARAFADRWTGSVESRFNPGPTF